MILARCLFFAEDRRLFREEDKTSSEEHKTWSGDNTPPQDEISPDKRRGNIKRQDPLRVLIARRPDTYIEATFIHVLSVEV